MFRFKFESNWFLCESFYSTGICIFQLIIHDWWEDWGLTLQFLQNPVCGVEVLWRVNLWIDRIIDRMEMCWMTLLHVVVCGSVSADVQLSWCCALLMMSDCTKEHLGLISLCFTHLLNLTYLMAESQAFYSCHAWLMSDETIQDLSYSNSQNLMLFIFLMID